jgi:hypothetical protein
MDRIVYCDPNSLSSLAITFSSPVYHEARALCIATTSYHRIQTHLLFLVLFLYSTATQCEYGPSMNPIFIPARLEITDGQSFPPPPLPHFSLASLLYNLSPNGIPNSCLQRLSAPFFDLFQSVLRVCFFTPQPHPRFLTLFFFLPRLSETGFCCPFSPRCTFKNNLFRKLPLGCWAVMSLVTLP